MPQNRSMKKHLRQSQKRAARNRVYRTRMRSALRAAQQAARAQSDDLAERLTAAQSALDRAARVGAVHRRNAARKKSRLMKAANAS